MVSFMREYISNKNSRFLLAALLCASLFGSLHHSAHAEGFKILDAKTTLVNNVYQLESNMSLQFSEDALEALRSGVPLIVLVNIEVLKDRNWWWDKTVAQLEQGYLLLYHALSEKYIIHNLNSGAQQNFSSLSAAIAALSKIKDLPVIDKNLLEKNSNYYMRLRTYLDIESLPAPMRPIAYISSQWKLESDWYTWPLKH
jgi:hypothetical protein